MFLQIQRIKKHLEWPDTSWTRLNLQLSIIIVVEKDTDKLIIELPTQESNIPGRNLLHVWSCSNFVYLSLIELWNRMDVCLRSLLIVVTISSWLPSWSLIGARSHVGSVLYARNEHKVWLANKWMLSRDKRAKDLWWLQVVKEVVVLGDNNPPHPSTAARFFDHEQNFPL